MKEFFYKKKYEIAIIIILLQTKTNGKKAITYVTARKII